MYKKRIFIVLSHLLLTTQYFYAMKIDTSEELYRLSVAKKFYYSCKLGKVEDIHTLRYKHKKDALRNVWNDVVDLDCNISHNNPLELAFDSRTKNPKTVLQDIVNVVYEISCIYPRISLLHEIVEREGATQKLLVTAIKKGVSINSIPEGSGYSYGPLGHYIIEKSASITHTDPILTWFIKEGAHIKGQTIKMGYNDNIFHNITRLRESNNEKYIARIGKAICFIKLAPLYEKIKHSKNFQNAQEICKDNPELQEVTGPRLKSHGFIEEKLRCYIRNY